MRERLSRRCDSIPRSATSATAGDWKKYFARTSPQSVYHAAAYKHVPMMEAQLFEAVANNVFGTRNVARAAAHWSERDDFVLVSSDKAVRPANVMGATKRLAELVCQAMAPRGTRVRGGAIRERAGVQWQRDSPVPASRSRAGGPFTVTHPGDAALLYDHSGSGATGAAGRGDASSRHAAGGEVFVLEMGEPVRIRIWRATWSC